MSPDLQFPKRWGEYVLVRPLGSGGMGTVFLALSRAGVGDRVCVIKRLTAETLSDPGRRRRFEREAEISRTLSFEGIARTIEVGEHEGEPYIAQEYIEGRTVDQLCSAAAGVGEHLSPVMVAQIGHRVASAMAHAHRRDVVHRDIAPSNVMVSFAGAVSLIDFGIARRSGDPSLTSTGQFIGRAVYTAPEVLQRGEADARSDIYSLGVLLWELLVGRLPALGELETHPAPSSVSTFDGVPPELDKLIVRALDPDPARRFLSAEDFAARLFQLAPGEGPSGELATLIGRCYDVARERELLKADIDEARALLPAPRVKRPVSLSPEGRRSHFRRWAWLYVLGAIPVFSAIAARALRQAPQSTAGDVVAARPSVDPEVATAPSPSQPPGHVPRPVAAPVALPPTPASPPAAAPATRSVSHAKPAAAAARTPLPPPLPASPSPSAAATGRLLDHARDSLHDGELEDAARSAREALETGSPRQQSAAHLILGRVFLIEGQRRQAAAEFVAAIELDPENSAASDHLASLRRKGVE